MSKMHPQFRTIGGVALVVGGLSLAAVPASGDVGLGNPIGIAFGKDAHLSTSLKARYSAESGERAFTASGVFKIKDTVIARFPSFGGVASTTIKSTRIHVSPGTVAKLRRAARRHHARRTTVTLTITSEGSRFTQDSYLVVGG